jgi:hypothetical protein
MTDDIGRSIYVLAGMPASGVTDIWHHDLPRLFGRYSDEVVKLIRRTGKSRYFFKNLKAKADREPNFSWPEQALLIVEITEACSFKKNSYHLFRDEDFVQQQFRNNLSDIFSHYSNKVINTIEPDLPLLAKKFLSSTRESSNVSLLYKNGDRETFQCIVGAWNKYLTEIDCALLRTESRWDNQRQNAGTIAEAHGRTRAIFSPHWKVRI